MYINGRTAHANTCTHMHARARKSCASQAPEAFSTNTNLQAMMQKSTQDGWVITWVSLKNLQAWTLGGLQLVKRGHRDKVASERTGTTHGALIRR
jgi:hypothetical protein